MVKHYPVPTDAREFLTGLLEEAGMDIVPPQVREKLFVELAQRLDAKLTLAALVAMPNKKVPSFEKLLSAKAPVFEVTQFLDENVPNIEHVYAQAIVEFRNSYLNK